MACCGINSFILIVCFANVRRFEFGIFLAWLTKGESGSATIRNIGLLVLAVVGMPFAIWRSVVAGRQADIAQRGLCNERYQKAVEMLGDGILAVRLGGIYALQVLAKEDPMWYHIQVMRIFSAFLRQPKAIHQAEVTRTRAIDIVDSHGSDVEDRAYDDVVEVLRAIGIRTNKEIELERDAGFDLVIYDANLRGLRIRDVVSFTYNVKSTGIFKPKDRNKRRFENLSQIHFRGVDFSSADLSFVDMSKAEFWDPKFNAARCVETDFSGTSWEGGTLKEAELYDADLSNARIREADLSSSNFSGANLSGVIFEDVNLLDAILRDANLSETCFSMGKYKNALLSPDGIRHFAVEVEEYHVGVRNLTQAQIDEACADPANPPLLKGVVDCVTGKPLVWKGKST